MSPVKVGFYQIIHYASHLIYSAQFSVKSIPGVFNLIYDNFRVSMQFFFYRFQFCIEYLHLHIYVSHFPFLFTILMHLFCNLCMKIPTSGLCVSPFVFLLIIIQIFLPVCKFNIFFGHQIYVNKRAIRPYDSIFLQFRQSLSSVSQIKLCQVWNAIYKFTFYLYSSLYSESSLLRIVSVYLIRILFVALRHCSFFFFFLKFSSLDAQPPIQCTGNHWWLSVKESACQYRRPPAMREKWVLSLDREDPLEKEIINRSSILAWEIPLTDLVWQFYVHEVTKSATIQ